MSNTKMRALVDRHLQRFGVSGSGRDWVTRALHPAGDHKSPGLPDQSAAAVLRPDYRIQTTIMAPSLAGSGLWDAYIWAPPGDVNAVYWATGPSPCDFTANTPPPGAEVGVLRLQPSLEGTYLYSMTQIATAGPFPVDGYRTVDFVSSVPVVDALAFRHQFKSITVHQIASAIADQGQVYAAQFAPLIQHQGLVNPDGEYNAGDRPLVGSWFTATLPTSEAQLTAMAPQFYMDASREGVYLPLRLAGPSQPFARPNLVGAVTTTQEGKFNVTSPLTFPFGCVITPTSALPNTIPWVFTTPTVHCGTDGSDPKLPNPLQFDTGYDNTNIGVIIFRGLTGGGGQLGASLQLKVVAGLEIMPNPGASNRVFAEVAAPYEPRALEAYYSLCLELKDAYPASYNSLSDILDTIGSVASKIWGVFEPAVRDVAPALVHAAVSKIPMMVTGAHRGGAPRIRALPAPARSRSLASRSSIRSTGGRRVTIGGKGSTRRRK